MELHGGHKKIKRMITIYGRQSSMPRVKPLKISEISAVSIGVNSMPIKIQDTTNPESNRNSNLEPEKSYLYPK